MASETENTSSNLLTNLKSLLKTYLIHDAQGRISISYEAKNDAIVGDPCVKTVYAYRGIGTTQIRYRKETNDTWDPDNQNWDDDNSVITPNPAVDPAP